MEGQGDELGSFIFRTTGYNSVRTLLSHRKPPSVRALSLTLTNNHSPFCHPIDIHFSDVRHTTKKQPFRLAEDSLTPLNRKSDNQPTRLTVNLLI
ncbi:hypothetical protein MNZ22_11865 [Aeromonas encheleia]|uniref:hypothetical protein n=1 Tax=Aeromonas encheleia TaxID=73010 RepID=UPI001F57227F|nr:hypothetical protein [Aeromonas encheleia]UNP87530.1 hypothetical protein MNZ22_11865 [Aeromonas encheleia]